ncbi:MAG: hypothetical protein RL021_1523 [Bacteroidota bacterium]
MLSAATYSYAGASFSERPYFQQEVRYTINVSLDDSVHQLRGAETLVYCNNSPDTLGLLYFHLWPNAYRDENTVLAKTYYSDGDRRFLRVGKRGRGGIDSLDFTADGQRISWELLTDTPDVAILRLNRPLLPGDSTVIHTPFLLKYPSAGISRLGHTGQAYYTTQWYPKPAVYDRNGWRYFPYVDKGEYYGEFGSFDVRITLPENYRVGATGMLVDGDREYAWLDSLSEVTSKIDTFNARQLSFPPSSPVTKTLHFRQDRVHDFAFFADKRWNVLKGNIRLSQSGRTVMSFAFFTNHQGNWWKRAPEYMARAVKDYSKWVGEYPYDAVTAVDVIYAEGADMEYPMITAIGSAGNPYQLDAVLAHEIGHNWFYGILGSNERLHPWQDEGMNSFTDRRYIFTEYASDSVSMNESFNRLGRWGKWTGNARMDGRLKQYYRYLADARQNIDQPLTLRSEDYTLRNYSDMVYAKTSLGFQYLLRYLGDSLFDACMHRYYDEWSFRHPEPDDLEEVFERVSGRPLDWLFDDWLKTTDKLDYAVKRITAGSDSFTVSLRNTGRIDGPVAISYHQPDGTAGTRWLEGFTKDTTVRISGRPSFERVIDNGNWMPEVNRKNNSIHGSGCFRKTEPLQLKLLTGIEQPERTQLYLAPALGWNYYNSLMAGFVIHNIGFPQKNLEFTAMPLFAFGTVDINGGGSISYRLHPGGYSIREIRVRTGIQRYAYANDRYSNPLADIDIRQTLRYVRMENSISVDLQNHHPRNNRKNTLQLRQISIDRDIPYVYNYASKKIRYDYFQLNASSSDYPKWDARAFSLSITGNRDFIRCWGQFDKRIPYDDPTKGIELRIGAGWADIRSTIQPDVDYNLRLSGYGGRNTEQSEYDRTGGGDDYLFDEVFLARSEATGILSQQFVPMEGGFSSRTYYYRQSSKSMGVVGVKAAVPGKLPVFLFANFAAFDQPRLSYNQNKISWEGGIEIRVVKDIFTVYLPLLFSKDINYAMEQQDLDFVERIRFELHLKKLNPLEKLNR